MSSTGFPDLGGFLFPRPSAAILAERHESQRPVNPAVLAVCGLGPYTGGHTDQFLRKLPFCLVPFKSQTPQPAFHRQNTLTRFLCRIHLAFEVLVVDSREALVLRCLMFPNAEKMFAAFDDVWAA